MSNQENKFYINLYRVYRVLIMNIIKTTVFSRLDAINEVLNNARKAKKHLSVAEFDLIANNISFIKNNFDIATNLSENYGLLLNQIKSIPKQINTSHITTTTMASRSHKPVNTTPPEEKTTIITAKDGNSVESVQTEVFEKLRNNRLSNNKKFKINKIIKSKKGIIIKSPPTENIDELIEFFQKENFSEKANIFKPKLLDPVITLKKVSKLTDHTNISTILTKMNQELIGKEDQIKLLFAIKNNDSHHDLVLRISPDVYSILKKMKNIYTDYESIRFKDRFYVKQCQNCFAFNADHTTKNCPHPKMCTCSTIGHHQCSNELKCPNCANHARFKNKDLNHKPNSSICPLYKQRIERVIANTDYGISSSPSHNPTTASSSIPSYSQILRSSQ